MKRAFVVLDAARRVVHAAGDLLGLLDATPETLDPDALDVLVADALSGTGHIVDVRDAAPERVVHVRVQRIELDEPVVEIVELEGGDQVDEAAAADSEHELTAAAHELKEPVTVSLLIARLLREQWDKLGPQARRDYLTRMDHHLTYVAEILHQRLGRARSWPGHGVPRPMPETFAVAGFVASRLEGHLRSEWLVQLDFKCSPTMVAFADPEHFWQILVTLIENAFEHGRPPVEVWIRDADGAVRVTVTDHGPGPPEPEAALFDPETTIDDAAYGPDEAPRGLGLPFARELARVNGGDIWCERREDGARFSFEVPAAAVSRRVSKAS